MVIEPSLGAAPGSPAARRDQVLDIEAYLLMVNEVKRKGGDPSSGPPLVDSPEDRIQYLGPELADDPIPSVLYVLSDHLRLAGLSSVEEAVLLLA